MAPKGQAQVNRFLKLRRSDTAAKKAVQKMTRTDRKKMAGSKKSGGKKKMGGGGGSH